MNFLKFNVDDYAQFACAIRNMGLTESQIKTLVDSAHTIFESSDDSKSLNFHADDHTPSTQKNKMIICPDCNGSGIGEDGHTCHSCDGTGKIYAENGYEGGILDEIENDEDPTAVQDDEFDPVEVNTGTETVDANSISLPPAKPIADRIVEMAHELTSSQTWAEIRHSIMSYAREHNIPSDYTDSITLGLANAFLSAKGQLKDILVGMKFNEPMFNVDYKVAPSVLGQHASMVIEEIVKTYHDMEAVTRSYIADVVKRNTTVGKLTDDSVKEIGRKCQDKVGSLLPDDAKLLYLPKEAMDTMDNDPTVAVKLGKFLLGASEINPFDKSMRGFLSVEDEPADSEKYSAAPKSRLIGTNGKVDRTALKARLTRGGSAVAPSDDFMTALGLAGNTGAEPAKSKRPPIEISANPTKEFSNSKRKNAPGKTNKQSMMDLI